MPPSTAQPSFDHSGEFGASFLLRLRRRVWLLGLTCAVAGAFGWLLVRDDPKIYERELTYVIRPSPALDDSAYADALSTIDRELTGVEPTLLRIVGRPEFLAQAIERSGRGNATNGLRATIRPGSNIVDITIQSSDRSFLGDLSTAVASLAEEWLDTTYRGVYVLDPLLVTARRDAVEPDVGHAIEVGIVIGAAAGLVVVLVETLVAPARARSRRSQRRGVRL